MLSLKLQWSHQERKDASQICSIESLADLNFESQSLVGANLSTRCLDLIGPSQRRAIGPKPIQTRLAADDRTRGRKTEAGRDSVGQRVTVDLGCE